MKKKLNAGYYIKISRAIFLLFWPFFILKVLEVFFLVKPWLLHQPPEGTLLTSVYLLKGQKFSF